MAGRKGATHGRTSALLNIRHNLTQDTVDLFRRQADARGLSHGDYLTLLVLTVAPDVEKRAEKLLKQATAARERRLAESRAKSDAALAEARTRAQSRREGVLASQMCRRAT